MGIEFSNGQISRAVPRWGWTLHVFLGGPPIDTLVSGHLADSYSVSVFVFHIEPLLVRKHVPDPGGVTTRAVLHFSTGTFLYFSTGAYSSKSLEEIREIILSVSGSSFLESPSDLSRDGAICHYLFHISLDAVYSEWKRQNNPLVGLIYVLG